MSTDTTPNTQKTAAQSTSAQSTSAQSAAAQSAAAQSAAAQPNGIANPLLAPWDGPFALPPFGAVSPELFLPAFDTAIIAAKADYEQIAGQTDAATFDNTITAMERAGEPLSRVSGLFFNLAGTDATPALQAIQREISPKLTAFGMDIAQDARLFARVDQLYNLREKLGLTAEEKQAIIRRWRGFVKAGAKLDHTGKAELKAGAERASAISTAFAQNVLKDEQDWTLVLDKAEDLSGLSQNQIDAAASAGTALGNPGKFVITLSRSSVEPFLAFADRRDLRQQAYGAWIKRGANGGATDNRALLSELLAIRTRAAQLLGHATYADMSLEFSMAKTPDAVRQLLENVWTPARQRASDERQRLQKAIVADGGSFAIAAWDWRYYAEKVRKADFDVNEADVKPYFVLDRMIAAAFDCATRLFGLSFREVPGQKLYHPDVRLWEVTRGAKLIGHFLGDYFARPTKRSGAWMSSFRGQHKLDDTALGGVRPLIINVLNFAKAPEGQPTLLSLDDARTLFHEFGHGLHGLLSDVTYPSLSGTSVARDFVELPSQLYEAWLMSDHVLSNYALHIDTGEPMSRDLVDRLKRAKNFNMGFATVEYLASALVDLDLHTRTEVAEIDVEQAEAATLARIGMPAEISMRHRTPHFQHILGGYAAGYYAYLWSEVLDADAFRAFEETGNVFDAATAKRLHDHIYSAGGREEPEVAYIGFRGRLPAIDALLEKRGFKAAA